MIRKLKEKYAALPFITRTVLELGCSLFIGPIFVLPLADFLWNGYVSGTAWLFSLLFLGFFCIFIVMAFVLGWSDFKDR